MSCAQVMYQPYAPSPYVVVPADAATPLAAPPHISGPATPGGGEGVLHLPSSATTTPHTPPHAHHLQPLPQARQSGEAAVGPVQGAADPSGGQCGQPRPQYRAPSNGSATADPDAPPPEKKFCSETEASTAPPPPPSQQQHQHTSPHLHHHHQQHHHHHHHHHHHPHHHPPVTEPPGSPSQHANEVKYVSANCMVVTHYAGDTAAVVDEHFTRALSTPLFEKPNSPGKASSPMSSRNFPPSFWNSNYQVPSSSRPPSLAGHLGASPAELYDPYHGGLHSLQPPAPDPWAAYSLSQQAYSHRSVAHDVYQAAMSSVQPSSRPYHQYSSLSLQPHLGRIPAVTAVGTQMGMAKPETWGARYHEAFSGPEFSHSLDTNYSTPHYTNVPGLETGVPQEGAKDLYWF